MPPLKNSSIGRRVKGKKRSRRGQLLKKKDNIQQTKTIQQCAEIATILEFQENTIFLNMGCPDDDIQNILGADESTLKTNTSLPPEMPSDFDHKFWEISNIVQMDSLTEKPDAHETLNAPQSTHDVRASAALDEFAKECQELGLDSMAFKREFEERPYNLECSELTLLSQDRFQETNQENAKQMLMEYWRFIGGYQIASHAYLDALKKFKVEKNLTNIVDWAPIQSKTAAFLVDIGEYQVAEEMLNEIIQPLINEKGDEAKELSEPLFIMVNLLFKKALQYNYRTHPGYIECHAKGTYYSELCVKVCEKHFADDEKYFGRVLLACGYFQRRTICLEKALKMFENINDEQGIAVALYNLGEKNQYNKDLNVPINMFTKSLALCLSIFGKFHLNTARCTQLYGQMYWNNWIHNGREDFLKSCLGMYQTELKILCEVQGDLHPNTVRSRQDVIILLQELGQDKKAETYKAQQPEENAAL